MTLGAPVSLPLSSGSELGVVGMAMLQLDFSTRALRAGVSVSGLPVVDGLSIGYRTDY